jgi:hypothetical protein
LSTNGIFFAALVALFFLAAAMGCSGDRDESSQSRSSEQLVPAGDFAALQLDLARIDRKYNKVFRSFLKRKGIEGGEYRLMADSVFIASHREDVEEYNELKDRQEGEKQEAFTRHGIDVDRYRDLLLALTTGDHPAWAESVTTMIKNAGP